MRDPKTVAAQFRAEEKANMEKAAPGLAATTVGAAALALFDAGKPITTKALIAHLLREAERADLMQPFFLAAARRLGWQSP